MADGGASLWVALAVAAASATTAAVAAEEQNKQVRRANDAAKNAAKVNKAQEKIAAVDQQAKLARQFALYEGAGRANAGNRGVIASRSSAALQTAALSTALTDRTNIELNEYVGNAQIGANLASQIASNNSNRRSAALDGFSGGLAGLSSGVNLGLGIKQLQEP